MQAKIFSEEEIKALASFRREYAEDEILPKKYDDETFKSMFFDKREGLDKANISYVSDSGEIIGFGNGCRLEGADKAFITYILVNKKYRCQGYGTKILNGLKEQLSAFGEPTQLFEASFYNPIGLSWCIPGTPRHDHPGVPGVDVLNTSYIWAKNRGFRDFAHQNSYYRCLEKYEITDDVKRSVQRAKDAGYIITVYDKNVHHSLNELFDNLHNEGWRKAIMGNEAKENPLPLLIVEEVATKRVCGFTGPLAVQESGRGYFAGIGVHTDCRGSGVGKALFSALCQGLKDEGATFMSLFTGEDNLARNIYEAAGFKIVRSWADMRTRVK